MTVHDTLQNTIVDSAEKIKSQRELVHKYLEAFNRLAQLRKDLSPSGHKQLYNWVGFRFFTISDTGHQDDCVVNLPTQCADDLIDYLSQYTAARTPD